MPRFRAVHAGWLAGLMVIVAAVVVAGTVWLGSQLGRQIAVRVHSTTRQWSALISDDIDTESLTHSLGSSRSQHHFYLAKSSPLANYLPADKSLDVRVEHVIHHGPFRLSRFALSDFCCAAGWVESVVVFPTEFSFEPLRIETKISFDGTAISHFNYGPLTYDTSSEALSWEGMTGELRYQRPLRVVSVDVTVGALSARSLLAEASFSGGQLQASGPVNRFTGQRRLHLTFDEAHLMYHRSNQRYDILKGELTYNSIDQSPHSSLRLIAGAEHIGLADSPWTSVRFDLSLERIAAAALLGTTPATPLEALALLLAHRPIATLALGAAAPGGPVDAYFQISAGPLPTAGISDPAGASDITMRSLIQTIDAYGRFSAPRSILETLLQRSFQAQVRDNSLLIPAGRSTHPLIAEVPSIASDLSLAPIQMLMPNRPYTTLAQEQLAQLEHYRLVIPDGTQSSSEITLSRGLLTINQREFDLFSVLSPFLE